MREPYDEGLTPHIGPESCVGRREAAGEALTGVHAGQVLSCETRLFRWPTSLSEAEGNTAQGAKCESCVARRSRRP